MSNIEATNNLFQHANRYGKKLLATTAMTALGLFSMTGNAAANNWNTTTTHGSTTADTSQTNIANAVLTTQRARIEGDLDIASGHTVNIGQRQLVAPNASTNNWVSTTTTHGSTTTDTSQANTTNITLNTQRARIEGDLDIDEGYTVNVGKGDLLAVDTENDAVGIYGNLNCAGSCQVIGKNLIIVGETGVVNANTVTFATGVDNAEQFMADGRSEVSNSGKGEIIIEGSVNADDFAGFFAPTVKNSGVINAKMGKIDIGASEKVTLDLYGDGLVEVAVDGELADGLIENTGTIQANGGNVMITADVAKKAVENVINLGGVVDVSSATMEGGKIVLSGGNNGTVSVKGTLDASGKNGQNAGSIKVTGKNIKVAKAAKIVADAKPSVVADGTEIELADVLESSHEFNDINVQAGNAGDIVVFADDVLDVEGSISAQSNNGTGFIETSGDYVNFAAGASILANREWLIDPINILIDAANEGVIESGLAVGDVTLVATNNIDLNTIIDWSTGSTFQLDAGNDINVNAGGGTNATGAGSTVFNAGNNIALNTGANGLVTNTGDITLNAGDEFILAGGKVSTFAGNILIDNAGSFEALANSIQNFGTGTTELNQNKPSGSGSIVNPTIQNAVDSVFTPLGSSSTTINVGAGTWVESVNLDYNNLTLNGNNAGVHGTVARNAETIIASVDGPAFSLTDTDQNVIDGFTIDGGNHAGSVAVQGDNADNLFIDNNIIVNNEVGVDVANSHCPHTRNNLIDNNGTGVRYTNNTHAFISVNTITNTTGHAVETNGVVENDIFQNIIDEVGGNAVDVTGGDDAFIFANLIGLNGDKDSIGGVGIQASNDVDRLIIDSNNIMNTAGDGIDLINIGQIDPDNQTFVRNNTISMAATIGIDAENSDNVFIDGNNISATPIGVEVTDSHCPFVINNTIDDVDTGVSFDNTTHSFIAQNTITNVTGNATQANGVVELDIFQNIIDEVGGNAVDVTDSDDALIFGNNIGINGGPNNIAGNAIELTNVD